MNEWIDQAKRDQIDQKEILSFNEYLEEIEKIHDNF